MQKTKYYDNNKNDIGIVRNNFNISLSSKDKLIGAKIINIEYVYEHLDRPEHPNYTNEILIELSNGSQIEIYMDENKIYEIQSD